MRLMMSKYRILRVTGGAVIAAAMLIGTPVRSSDRLSALRSSTEGHRDLAQAPDLIGSREDWLNTGGRSVHLFSPSGKPFAGHIYVLTFWTTHCINCERTLPIWNAWAKKYTAAGDVALISVHTPETRWERDPATVARTARQRGLVFPILIDNDEKNWDAYSVQSWPTTLLIDKQGRIRNRWEGELNFENSNLYRQVEAQIEILRRENP